MEIKITAKNIKLTPAIKNYATTRVSKIENYSENIVWAQAVLSVEKKINQRAEIIIHLADKKTITASAVEADIYKAIEAAALKAEAQIRKIKGKKITKRVKKGIKDVAVDPMDIPFMINPGFAQGGEVRFSVVKQVEVRPMNPEAAANEMERLGYTFWMFLDEGSNQLNLIFRRLDNSYGLIKPIKKK